MAKAVGGNETNAIEVIAFVLHFDAPVLAHELSAFSEDSFSKDRYPGFTRNMVQRIDFNPVSGSAPMVQQVHTMFPMWQKFNPSGKIIHELRLEQQSLVYVCTEYTSWHEIATNVLLDFEVIMAKLAEKKLDRLVLQVTDKFRLDESESVMDSLFSSSTIYLTEKAKNSGKLWHVHQGWFDELQDDEKMLNVLNLGSLEILGSDKVDVVIDHMCEVRFEQPKPISKEVLEGCFDHAHSENKSILIDLLQTEIQDFIGLIKK